MPPTLQRASRRLLLTVAALTAACGGGENPITPSSIGLSLDPSTLTVAQGASGTLAVSTPRTNFASDISLSASGAPAGVTVSFAPGVLTGNTAGSTMTIAPSATASPGTATITVTARGTGVAERTATIALTVPQPPAFTLTLASAALSVNAGGSATVNATLARTNFTGAVTFAVSGLPAGATSAFAPNPATGDASVLTINTGTAAPGTYALTVTASAGGLSDRTAALTLTVAASSYTLGLSSSSASVVQGASTTADVALVRTNFAGSVALAASGVPAGASVTFAPAATTGNTSVMTVNAGTAAPGAYTITVTGSATGIADRTATFQLTINTSSSSINVSFTFCANDLPTWVAYQSGTGAWQQASIGANNTYSFAVATRGGVAIVEPLGGDPSQSGYQTTVFYASASELQSIGSTWCGNTAPVGTKVVNGSVTGSGGNSSTIVLGESESGATGDGAYQLIEVQNGAHDLLATLNNSTTFTPTRMVIRRNQDPASGATLAPIDFAGSESFAPVSSTVSLPGIASSTPLLVFSTFTTANGSSISLGFQQTTVGAASYLGVPSAVAGDLHELDIFLDEATGFRGSFSYFTTAGNRTLAFGAPLNVATVTSLGSAPYPRLRAQYASQAEYASLAYVSFTQAGISSGPSDRSVDVIMTPAYLGGVPATWDLSIPDLSGAAGFSNGWMLGAGRQTEVATAAYGGNIFQTIPTNGTVFQFAQRTGTATTAASASPSPLRLSPAAPSRTTIEARTIRIQRIAHNRRLLRRR